MSRSLFWLQSVKATERGLLLKDGNPSSNSEDLTELHSVYQDPSFRCCKDKDSQLQIKKKKGAVFIQGHILEKDELNRYRPFSFLYFETSLFLMKNSKKTLQDILKDQHLTLDTKANKEISRRFSRVGPVLIVCCLVIAMSFFYFKISKG